MRKAANEFLNQKAASRELSYYQRLFRSILLAFAEEDGVDSRERYVRRLRGEDERPEKRMVESPRACSSRMSGRSKSQSVYGSGVPREPQVLSPNKSREALISHHQDY